MARIPFERFGDPEWMSAALRADDAGETQWAVYDVLEGTLLVERGDEPTAQAAGVASAQCALDAAAEFGTASPAPSREPSFVYLEPTVAIAPDASYLADLKRAREWLLKAGDALVYIVASGTADYDSDVGRAASEAGDLIAEIGERVDYAVDEPDARTRGLLRGKR